MRQAPVRRSSQRSAVIAQGFTSPVAASCCSASSVGNRICRLAFSGCAAADRLLSLNATRLIRPQPGCPRIAATTRQGQPRRQVGWIVWIEEQHMATGTASTGSAQECGPVAARGLVAGMWRSVAGGHGATQRQRRTSGQIRVRGRQWKRARVRTDEAQALQSMDPPEPRQR